MKEIKPKFIKDRKIAYIEEFIRLNTVGKVKTVCLMHIANIKTVRYPDPDELYQTMQDYATTIFPTRKGVPQNEALRELEMQKYKEA